MPGCVTITLMAEADNQTPTETSSQGDAPISPAPFVSSDWTTSYDDQPAPLAPADDSNAISWTASEYIAHHKDARWYIALGIGSVLLAAGLGLITRDLLTAIIVLICGLALGAYGARQPRTLTYRIDHDGLTIGAKTLPYGLFKSFSVVPEGAFTSIVLTPLKRCAPMTTLYYPPDQEDAILAHLSAYLPMEERKPDPIDRLMYRIRF